MPRFRVIKEVPAAVAFRNGTVHFTQYEGLIACAVWVARRTELTNTQVTLCEAPTMDELLRIRADGFEVSAGSPADKILQALTRLGVAELLPEEH